MEIEKSQLGSNNCCRQESSIDAKINRKGMIINKMFAQSRSISPKILITKGNTVTLQRETWPGSLQASEQSVKRQPTSRTSGGDALRGRGISHVVFSPKIHNPNLSVSKHRTNLNSGAFINMSRHILQKCPSHGSRERSRDCHRVRRLRRRDKQMQCGVLHWIPDQKEKHQYEKW